MKPHILLALACAAALLIGLTAWLSIDRCAPSIVDVARASSGPPAVEASLELNTAPRAPDTAAERTPVAAEKPSTRAKDAPAIETLRGVSMLTGMVTSTKDGRALADATIDAWGPGIARDASAPIEVRSSAYGAFVIRNVRSGRWVLSCSAGGFKPVERVVMVPDSPDPFESDFALTPDTQRPKLLVRLRGTDGRPFLSALDGPELEAAKVLRPVVLATCPLRHVDLPPGASALPIRATSAGRAHSDDWYEIAMDSRESACCCLLLGNRVLDFAPITPDTDSIVLTASRDDLQRSFGSLSVTVVDDASGEPLLAVVEVHPETGPTRNTTTDANGKAGADHLLQGDLFVRVHSDLRAPITRRAVIRPGETVDLGVIRMVKTVDITGWVEDPVAGASGHKVVHASGADPVQSDEVRTPSVFAYRIDPEQPLPQDPTATENADASGAFQLASLSPGEYLISSVRNRPPSIQTVREHKVLGWVYVDARFGSVSGVRVP